MKVDYIIVGAGLAGLSMAHFCRRYNRSFVIFDHAERTSSRVAGGMFNPVILKRFTGFWESQAQLDLAEVFYPEVEELLHSSFYHRLPIFRKFASIEEQNNWFVACDNLATAPFLNHELRKEKFNNVRSPYYFGEVFNTGYLDVQKFMVLYQEYLYAQGIMLRERFDYDGLIIHNDGVVYKNISAGQIVFAEGFSMLDNPYFNYLPLDGTKGELLYVKIPGLKLDVIMKSGVFLIPVGDDIYKLGATYDRNDKSDTPTETSRQELLEGLEALISCEYKVLDHVAGIRPTVNDRRPLVGKHYELDHVYLLNGLGTRGVLLGPYLADKLIRNIENDLSLDHNINVNRYYKKLQLIK